MRMGEQKTGSILTCWAIISIFCSGAIWSSIVYLKLSHRSWNVEPDAWSLKSSARGGASEERTLSFHSMDCPLPKKKEDRSHLEATWVDDETEKLWEIFGERISGWWFGTWILWLSIQLGMSSYQLTNSIIFQRGRYTTYQILYYI